MIDVQSGFINDLYEQIVSALEKKISVADSDFDITLLQNDVESAIREVAEIRKYPHSYSEQMIADDLSNFSSKIYNLALFDYASTGMSFQKSHSESSVNMTFMDRNSILSGVLPLARF